MDEQPAVRPDDAVIRRASETSRGPWTGAAGTSVHGTQRRRPSETAARRALPALRRPGKGRTARRRRVGERPRGSRGGGPTGRRQGRGRPRGQGIGGGCGFSGSPPGAGAATLERVSSGPVSFSVYCFLDLELERRRPRDYKPSPRVCAEEPRGLAVGSGGHAPPAPPGCSGR